MTSKEFAHIREFYGTHYNLAMRGHIWLFPKAIKHMKKASDVTKSWAKQKKAIYIRPKTMRISGDNLRICCPFSGFMEVPRKWIKCVKLNHYNY